MNQNYNIDTKGWILLGLLFAFIGYNGYLSYIAIDWDVLKKLEATPLILPTQAPKPTLTPTISPTPTLKPKPIKKVTK